jgi:FMN phosphatase YigB (HAD superfamily)
LRLAEVQGVLFELGDVLYDATLWRRWFANLLARIGLKTDFREFFAAWDARFAREMHCGRQTFELAFRNFLAATGLSHGQIDEIVVACGSKRRDFKDNLCPYPGVRGVLHQLAGSGLRLGVLTDSELPAAQLEQRLARMHLSECFEVVISSRDLGRAKPDAACYRAAAEELGVEPSAAAFVGVREGDLTGAAAAGCMPVSAPGGARLTGVVCVHRFEDIRRVLGAQEPVSLAG